MGSCFGKQNHKSIIKLTCPYCSSFNTFNTKTYEKHIMNCIELDKYFTVNNFIK